MPLRMLSQACLHFYRPFCWETLLVKWTGFPSVLEDADTESFSIVEVWRRLYSCVRVQVLSCDTCNLK